MSNLGQDIALTLLTKKSCTTHPNTPGCRGAAVPVKAPPAPSWHFPHLLQPFNYTHSSLLALLLLSSPAQDLPPSDDGFVLVDIQRNALHCWHALRSQGARPACPIWLLISPEKLLLLIRLTWFPRSPLLRWRFCLRPIAKAARAHAAAPGHLLGHSHPLVADRHTQAPNPSLWRAIAPNLPSVLQTRLLLAA